MSLLSADRRERKVRDFMPPWYQDLTAEQDDLAMFMRLRAMAEDGVRADNQHTDG